MKKQIYDEKNGMSYNSCMRLFAGSGFLREEEPTYGKI